MERGRDAKPHIGIFGRRNNGKSSLINSLTGQDVAIVSTIAGTTTDPVKKSIEIPGIGPVVMIDTAGLDAVVFVNSETGKKLHLRGVNAKVIKPGIIQKGDLVCKVQGGA